MKNTILASFFLLLFSSASLGEAPAVVHLEKRDTRITIRTTTAGPVYDLRKNGKWIAKGLDKAQLKKSHPEVYKLIDNAIVNEEGFRPLFIDATYWEN